MNNIQKKTIYRSLLGIFAISVILRVAAAIYLGNSVEILPGTYDQISYHNLALRVLSGHGFTFGEGWWPLTAANAPTAHWSYLYTLYLTIIYAIFGPNPVVARLIQAILTGFAQPFLAFLIGKKIFGDFVGLLSAALTAIYIYFVYYAATLMTEPFYITLILCGLYLAMVMAEKLAEIGTSTSSHRYYLIALLLGLSLGSAVLLRQLFLLIIPFIFLWLWFACQKSQRTNLVKGLIISSIVIVLLILPFTFYNYRRFNRFVLLNTNAGYAFFWANHPIYGTKFIPILPPEMGSYQSLIPESVRNLDEAALDQELLKRGIRFVVEDPVRYLLLSVSRIPAYFMFWPLPDSSTISNASRVLSFGVFWPFMLYGILISFIRDFPRIRLKLSSPIIFLLLFGVLYSAIHIFSWSLIRYRLPVDAVLLIFAGLAFADITQRIGRRNHVLGWEYYKHN